MGKFDGKELDLTVCETEPIRHLGLIQPHGCLLAADGHGLITHVSDNLRYFLPIASKRILGLTLDETLAGSELEGLADHFSPPYEPAEACYPLSNVQNERCVWTWWNGSRFVLEIEQQPSVQNNDMEEHRRQVNAGIESLQNLGNIYRQAQLTAELVSSVSHYDRILIYRFLEDWSGEVIAEVRRSYAEPFLGLRYPASDIPPQARQLYVENKLRVIVDVGAPPVGIISLAAEMAPLDLSRSKLRAVSQFHIEYLRNMGVAATATASLIVEGKLWGLIACHNSRRRGLSWLVRESLQRIAESASEIIARTQLRAQRRSKARTSENMAALFAQIQTPRSALLATMFYAHGLTRLFRACGVAVWSEIGAIRVFEAPDFEWINRYVREQLTSGEDLRHSQALKEQTPGELITTSANRIAGVVSMRLFSNPDIVLLCFRTENISEVIWGGDVRQPVLKNERLGKLSPRRSFAAHRELLQGIATEWSEDDLENATELARVIRRALGDEKSAADSLTHLLAEGRRAVTERANAPSSFLHVLGEGVSLVFRSREKDPAVQYVNNKLLELLDLEEDQSHDIGTLSQVMRPAGVSQDLLQDLTHRPQQITIHTGSQGLRNLVVEYKNALEISDAEGIAGLSAMLFTDTTRFERGREALEAAEAQARHLSSLKTAFLANMSHEIRTPLNGIIGMVQVLQGTDPTPEQAQYLKIMEQSSESLMLVINDVLDLSKIEAGALALESVPFDLKRVVKDVVDLVKVNATEKGIALTATIDVGAQTSLKGDPNRLRQILLNLMGNAVKFTSKGEVSMHVSCEESDVGQTRAIFSISDTGIGISDEQGEHIFEKFRQADQSTTRKYGGTGLGLSIAKELVIQMGGEISFISSLGKGSTFVVTLPVIIHDDGAGMEAMESAGAGKGPEPAAVLRQADRIRILVADDNSFNLKAIEAMLKRRGLELDFASSGREAVDRWETGTYDLILMDCHMNGMDGYEATKAIRKAEAGKHRTPIIALTADVMQQNEQLCKEAGMDDYLAKPVRLEKLRAAVDKWTLVT